VRRWRPSAVAPARLVSLERVLTAPARAQLACPDKWKDGSREQSSGGRKLNVNKLLLKRPGWVPPSTTTHARSLRVRRLARGGRRGWQRR